MNYSRRNFIKASSASVVIAGLASAVPGMIVPGFDTIDAGDALSSLDAGLFQKLIGEDFTLYTEDGAFSAFLEDVVVQSVRTREAQKAEDGAFAGTDCFHLKFTTPSAELGQGTYRVFNKVAGQFDLLMVPRQNEAGAPGLTATFNRL